MNAHQLEARARAMFILRTLSFADASGVWRPIAVPCRRRRQILHAPHEQVCHLFQHGAGDFPSRIRGQIHGLAVMQFARFAGTCQA